jgi:outer membrane protein TolC
MKAFTLTTRVAAALVAVLGVATGGHAQTTPRAVTFEEAIARALERNPTIAIAATSIARADVLVRESRASLMPYAEMRLSNVTLDAARGFNGDTFQPQNQFFFTPSVSVPILALWRRSIVEQARDQIEVANRTVEEVRQQVAVATAEAYLQVIAARRQLEIDESALKTAQAHLDYATRRLEGGIGSRLNQARAAQTVEITLARIEAVRILLRRAQEALGVMLAEDGPVDARGEPVFEQPGTIDEANWAAARPDLQLQAAVKRSSERVIHDAFKDWTPTATANFAPTLVGPAGLFQPSRTWQLSFTVTQPLFKGGLKKNLDARLAEVSLTEATLAEARIRIEARSEIRIAQEALAGAERAEANSRRAAEHAREVLKITSTAFEVGATTNLEVIEAQQSARDSETAANLAEDAVRRARLDLLVALGRFPK